MAQFRSWKIWGGVGLLSVLALEPVCIRAERKNFNQVP